MRVLPVFLVILLLPSIARSYEPAAIGFVIVAQPLIRYVPTQQHLRDWCGAPGEFEACTRFIGFRLEASCTPAGRQWIMEATATFRPWIFVRGSAHLAHEHEHIRDVERFTAEHVAGLRGLMFADADHCRQRSIHEAAQFGEAMRVFARRSNEERHPVLAGARYEREKLRMARGWESKSVESQMEEGPRREAKDHRDRDDVERARKRDSLEMSRRSIVHDLETARTETHRAALQNALNFIDDELKKLGER
jgi:hypothetical protein